MFSISPFVLLMHALCMVLSTACWSHSSPHWASLFSVEICPSTLSAFGITWAFLLWSCISTRWFLWCIEASSTIQLFKVPCTDNVWSFKRSCFCSSKWVSNSSRNFSHTSVGFRMSALFLNLYESKHQRSSSPETNNMWPTCPLPQYVLYGGNTVRSTAWKTEPFNDILSCHPWHDRLNYSSEYFDLLCISLFINKY